ncbi:MAG: adenylosuccinate lyase, partial [Clostridia bacterium]|nr:adenylosuccinate lyase [Clostridia bacterium]
MDRTTYVNPLTTRYASKQMQTVFSEENRIRLFRELWTALAESQMEMGLNVTEKQVNELRANILPINFDAAEKREKEVRHDVMAHVYAFGLQCPSAAPIIHLGATSCYVTDNADIIIYKRALELIRTKLAAVMSKLAAFASKYKSLPTLGFTHLQPAQLVTVGKRAAMWLQDFFMDYNAVDALIGGLKLRGVKGTTGTQASFMELFDNDGKKVRALEKLVVQKMGFKAAFTVSGQTYTRKLDYNITSVLSMLAQSASKFSSDMRLLQNMKELEEPFEKKQIGSSAMAYKRNPMRSERIASLSRYIITLPANAAFTASSQWLERTLDDSANRRIVMADAFLAADAVLELLLNVIDGIVVYKKVIQKHIAEELPFMATEVVLMQCVKAGGDRQLLHEAIREHSMEAAKKVKLEGKRNDLISRIKADARFEAIHDKIDSILNPKNFIGRAPAQVEELIKEVSPVIKRY